MNPHLHSGYFTQSLESIDPQVFQSLSAEEQRQQEGIELIASENLVSRATLEALGTANFQQNRRGYPGARYYGGAQNADRLETLAISRAKNSLNADTPTFSPIPEARQNPAVFLAYLKPGDTVLRWTFPQEDTSAMDLLPI
ncbi:MAG: hypothetical protein Ct9H90mP8_3120 [Pseudomonadota bacterium]|nr:MAG: hypothetical protein Ct9H90mP8_3120 [Pseudomonadota bacterium]